MKHSALLQFTVLNFTMLLYNILKGVPKKCNNRFCVKMGLPIENLYKMDPPEPYLNFQKIILKIIFFEQIDPKNPKITPKNY